MYAEKSSLLFKLTMNCQNICLFYNLVVNIIINVIINIPTYNAYFFNLSNLV